MKYDKDSYIKIWLLISAIIVLLMILLGGLTRLTHSGLSMVEWQLFNIFPPLNEQSWNLEFTKYQASPEFEQINNDMTVTDFKSIFWLEYLHRLLGRFCGLFIIVPMIYFCYYNYFQKQKIWPIILAILVVMQGVIGWYMVKSGLIKNPNVSHYRLAMHLSCAIILYGFILCKLFEYSQVRKYLVSKKIKIIILLLLLCTFLQIILGAFVAGLKAGMIYNQFPFMGESFIPSEIYSLKDNFFSDEVFIQFLHRSMAYVIVMLSFYASFLLHKQHLYQAFLLVIIPIIQSILGVITLIYLVPTGVALMHQMGSVILISLLLFYNYQFRIIK